MTALGRLPVFMTSAEFIAWNQEGSERFELVDGRPRPMAPPSVIHGYLQTELASLIRMHLKTQNSPCRVIANPGVVPRLMPDHNFRVSDLGVTCSPVAPAQITLTDPILLVEILSPSNQPETWSNVWAYTTIPSVQEVLVLHTNRMEAEILRRAPNGEWPQRFEAPADDMLALQSIGLQISLPELYAGTGLAA